MAEKSETNPRGAGRKPKNKEAKVFQLAALQSVNFIFDELENILSEFQNDLGFPEMIEGERKFSDPIFNQITNILKKVEEKKSTTSGRGVVLIAGGHPYYGQMAANLATALKLSDMNINIHLAYHGNALQHLDEMKRNLFNTIELIPDYFVADKGKISYFKAKTYLYELSPFEETLFLDVDMMWLPRYSITKVFEQFKGIDFTISNRDRYDIANYGNKNYMWANIAEIKSAYGFENGFIYQLHSEFIYFKRSDKIEKYFETVKEIYENPRVKINPIAGTVPDEIAFALAGVIHNIYPHQFPFVPVYWYLSDSRKGTSLEYVANNYMAYSIGGNATPELVRSRYNLLAKSHAQRMNIQSAWSCVPKKRWLPERVKI